MSDTFYATLFGALIGATPPTLAIIYQLCVQEKRERFQLITKLAHDNYNTQVEMSKRMTGKTIAFPPLYTYIIFYKKLMDLTEKGALSEKDILALSAEQRKLEKLLTD